MRQEIRQAESLPGGEWFWALATMNPQPDAGNTAIPWVGSEGKIAHQSPLPALLVSYRSDLRQNGEQIHRRDAEGAE